MKKFLTTLFIWSAFNSIVIAQYTEIPLPFPDTTRFKVQFVDEMHGWVSSWTGTILRTTNGGITWDKFDSPHPNKISHINFSSSDYGIIWADSINSAGAGKLYRTKDGGKNWDRISNFDSMWVQVNLNLYRRNYGNEYAIKTIAPNHVAAHVQRYYNIGGSFQTIPLFVSTTNDGVTWQAEPESTYIRGTNQVFVPLDTTTWGILDADRGIIPDITPISAFRLSTDRGRNWRFTNIWVDKSTLTSEFTDAKHGIIFHVGTKFVGYGMSITRDGGETWDHWEFLPSGFSGKLVNDTTVYYIRGIVGSDNKPMYGELWRVIHHPSTLVNARNNVFPYSIYAISSIGEKIFALTIEGRLFVIDNTLVSIKEAVSILPTNFDFDLFPNPSSRFVHILSRMSKQYEGTIEVFNSVGICLKKITTVLHDQDYLRLDLSTLQPGNYFLVLKDKERASVKPFTIIK